MTNLVFSKPSDSGIENCMDGFEMAMEWPRYRTGKLSAFSSNVYVYCDECENYYYLKGSAFDEAVCPGAVHTGTHFEMDH
jgi:hypothetical protein